MKNESDKLILCDPQTSGGLLIAVEPYAISEVEKLLKENDIDAQALGYLEDRKDFLIKVL